MRRFLLLALFPLCLLTGCNTGPNTYAIIKTNHGTVKIWLYDQTPNHKANFIKLADEGFYDGLLFHRIIPNFMIQGGDPTSKNASPGQSLGGGSPGYTIKQEIGAPHIRGAVAAARTPDYQNPEFESNGSQFYIVTGRPVSAVGLGAIEQQFGKRYSDAQKALYVEQGGRPDLDHKYTVFGMVVEGIEVIEEISEVETAAADRPVEDVRIESIRIRGPRS